MLAKQEGNLGNLSRTQLIPAICGIEARSGWRENKDITLSEVSSINKILKLKPQLSTSRSTVTWPSEIFTTTMARYLEVELHQTAICDDDIDTDTELEEHHDDDDDDGDNDEILQGRRVTSECKDGVAREKRS